MNSLIIGRGEVGRAVASVVAKTDDFSIYDIKDKKSSSRYNIDILHICFPYADDFVSEVKAYVMQYKPKHVLIWSTVPIGTTKKIHGAVHTPVEGIHPKLDRSIRSMVRWIGNNDQAEVEFYAKYFRRLHISARFVGNSDFTEFLKLRSTAKYGVNLVWTDYEAKTAQKLAMDFGLLQDFDRDYNKLYHNLGMDRVKRYVLDPPKGKIGGHCVVPNAELLDEQYPNELLKMIKGMK